MHKEAWAESQGNLTYENDVSRRKNSDSEESLVGGRVPFSSKSLKNLGNIEIEEDAGSV